MSSNRFTMCYSTDRYFNGFVPHCTSRQKTTTGRHSHKSQECVALDQQEGDRVDAGAKDHLFQMLKHWFLLLRHSLLLTGRVLLVSKPNEPTNYDRLPWNVILWHHFGQVCVMKWGGGS